MSKALALLSYLLELFVVFVFACKEVDRQVDERCREGGRELAEEGRCCGRHESGRVVIGLRPPRRGTGSG